MQIVIYTLKHMKQTKNYPHSKYVDLGPPSCLRVMKSILYFNMFFGADEWGTF